MSPRVLAIVIVVIACAANHPPATKSIARSACPTPRSDSTKASATKVGDATAMRRVHSQTLLSIIIDGRIAVWNYPQSQMDDYTSPYNPSLSASELKSVILVDPEKAERLYGTCPGVPVFVIETKAGNWHPADSTLRR
jgi:hypothetical protein